MRFSAQLSNGTNNVIKWDVNGVKGGNSTLGTIDSNGVYIAPSAVPSPATVTVNATSFEDSTLVIPAMVTIIPPPVVKITPTSATVASGGTIAFMSTETGAATTLVDWYVNNVFGGNAASGTILSTGIYTAPNTPPIGSTVTVTAKSRDFPLSSANATVTVSGYSLASFKGPYAFSISGTNAAGAFFRAGSFTADGAGNLATGLEDLHDSSGVAQNLSFAGTYSVGVDGRGTMKFSDGRTPASFDFVVVNSSQIQFIGFDATGTSSGQASLQSPATFQISSLFGAYVFDLTGVDASGKPLSEIGEFTADGAGGITPGLVDISDNGVISSSAAPITGSYAADVTNPGSLSSNGRGLLTLQLPGGARQFAFYIVSRGTAKLVEIDPTQAVAGTISQQDPNAVFGLASLNGNYIVQLAGSSPGGLIATAGVISPNGIGGITSGTFDESNAGTINSNFSLSAGTYTVASTTGRGTASFTALGRACKLVFYLGPAGTAVVQETDSSIVSDGLFAFQQAIPSTTLNAIQGTYALNSSGAVGASPQFYTGQVTANGLGTISSGVIDINAAGVLTPAAGQSLTGTYTMAVTGRGTISLTPSLNFAVYFISPTRATIVGLDATKVAAGQINRQF